MNLLKSVENQSVMTLRTKVAFYIFTFFFFAHQAIGQDDPIKLLNPSFEEGSPRVGQYGWMPQFWYDCGSLEYHPGETPPDLHGEEADGSLSNHFQVEKRAQDGKVFLGLVVRDNDTWEAVSQRLSTALQPGKCYELSLYVARSDKYLSPVGNRDVAAPEGNANTVESNTGNGKTMVNHNTPTVLKIWGANTQCGKKEMLRETPVVTTERWLKVDLKLEPKGNYSYLIFEAFYKTPTLFPYNGNLLIDNISDIELVPCTEPEPAVAITNKKKSKTNIKKYTLTGDVQNVIKKDGILIVINNQLVEDFSFDKSTGKVSVQTRLKKGQNTFKIKVNNSKGTAEDTHEVLYEEEAIAVAPTPDPEPTPSSYENTTPTNVPPPPPPPKITKGLDRATLSKGKTIQINKLYFDMNAFEINEGSKPALEEVYQFLIKNNDIVVEIGGHTNNRCDAVYCNSLSEKRAKAVVDYLKDKGITNDRLAYKGYGKTKAVATNNTPEGRKKNQRVEIKVLSIGR